MARKNGPDPKKNLKSQGRETARSIDQYLENNNIEEARSLYESLSKLGRSPAADSLKAKAAFKLIRWYAENGKPENTGPLLSALARRSENPEILMLQVKAVSLMIGPRPEKEQTKEVRLLRQSLWTPQGQVSQRDRSQILLNLISELCQKNQTDEALEIYSTLKIDSLPEEAAEFLPSLESAIIISLTENGRLTEALDFFQASRNAAWSPDALNRAAPAAARLTAALACRQELDKALGVWSFFEIPVLPESVRHLRLKTALILMEILILYDRFQDALAVWHSLPKRKNYISESSLAGPLAEQIALIFPHLSGRPEEAKRLFLSSQDIFYLRRGLNAEERLRYYTGFMYTVRACAGTYLTDPENSLENLKWAAAETLIFGTDLNAFSPAPEEHTPRVLKTKTSLQEAAVLDDLYRSQRCAWALILEAAVRRAGLPEAAELSQIPAAEEDFCRLTGQAEALCILSGLKNLTAEESLKIPALAEECRDYFTRLCLSDQLWKKTAGPGINPRLGLSRAVSGLAAFSVSFTDGEMKEQTRLFADRTPWTVFQIGADHIARTMFLVSHPGWDLNILPDRSPEGPADPEGRAAAARTVSSLLDLLLGAAYSDNPHKVLEDFNPDEWDNLPANLSQNQLTDLRKGAERALKQCFHLKDQPASAKILAFIPKLGRAPAALLTGWICRSKILEKYIAASQSEEALAAYEGILNLLAPGAGPDAGPDTGPVPAWAALALTASFGEFQKLNFSAMVRPSLERYLKILAGLPSGRLPSLMLADVLARMLQGDCLSRSEELAEFMKTVYETAAGLPVREDWLEAEKIFFSRCLTLSRLAYMTFLAGVSRLDEALEMYLSPWEPGSRSPETGRQEAQFLSCLIIALISARRLTEARRQYEHFDSFCLAEEFESIRQEAASRIITALTEQGDLAAAREIAMPEGEIPAGGNWTFRLRNQGFLVEACCRRDQISEAQAVYLDMKKAPISQPVWNLRVQALLVLTASLISRGRTAAAAHLFISRDPFSLELFPELDPNSETKHQRITVTIGAVTKAETKPYSRLAGEAMRLSRQCSETGVELIKESLDEDDLDQAASILATVVSLPASEIPQITSATHLVAEKMIQIGREDEALALLEQLLEKMPSELTLIFKLQTERLITAARKGRPAS